MASPNVHSFTDSNFESEVISSDVPVLVDFTATWCAPCQVMSPIVDQLAADLAGKVKVGKLDIDASPQMASKYGVRGVPTFMVFKGGKRVAEHIGQTSKSRLATLVSG